MRLSRQVPKTLDNMREADETIMLSDDEEVRNDEDEDEFAAYFDGETPKTIITSANKPSKAVIEFIKALLHLMPGSYYYERRNFEIKDIAKALILKSRLFSDFTLEIYLGTDFQDSSPVGRGARLHESHHPRAGPPVRRAQEKPVRVPAHPPARGPIAALPPV